MATKEESLKFKCPDCGALPGDDCLYLWPSGLRDYGSPEKNRRWHSGTKMALIERVGTPTQLPHNGRRNRANDFLHPIRRPLDPVTRISPRRLKIARLQNAFEREEQRKVFAFLRRWGNIFVFPDPEDRMLPSTGTEPPDEGLSDPSPRRDGLDVSTAHAGRPVLRVGQGDHGGEPAELRHPTDVPDGGRLHDLLDPAPGGRRRRGTAVVPAGDAPAVTPAQPGGRP